MKKYTFLMKAIGFAGCLLLTLFAGLFALIALAVFVSSIIDFCLLGVVASVASAFVSALCWSIRKDVLYV